MKNKLLLLLLTSYIISFAQIGPQQVITTSASEPLSVYATDLDGDGDIDILSASQNDSKIAWYENINGLGSFGPQQIITTSANGARSVFAKDLDGDGDMDVLSASLNDDTIAYYKNNGGNFTSPFEISTNADGAASVYATDIDNDNNIDVLSASFFDDKVSWYRNVNGTFIEKIITTNANGAISVFTADIDGDGDSDVLSASRVDNKIAWYENTDGIGTFTNPEQIITTNALGAGSVYAIDIDADGDMDVISASLNDNTIAWYENTNGLGSFGTQQIISTSAFGAVSVYAADMDNDGDMDVLSASVDDDKIAWYENINGQGSFGTQQIITTNANFATSVFATDLDNDGDIDVLSASLNDDKIAWYENTTVLSIDDFEKKPVISFFPNPATHNINIKVPLGEQITTINLYNVIGEKMTLQSLENNTLNLSHLSSGIYLLKIAIDKQTVMKKLVIN